MLDAEPLARPPPSRDHLVRDEQNAMPVAYLAQGRPVLRRGNGHARRERHGLGDHRSDRLRPLLYDDVLHRLGALDAELRRRERLVGAAVVGRLRREAEVVRQDGVVLASAQHGRGGHAERAPRRPVIRALAPDELAAAGLPAVVVIPIGDLQSRLNRLGSAAREVDAIEVARRERRDFGGEPGGGLVAVLERVGVVQPAELRGHRVHDLAPPVPDVDEHQPRHAVVAPAPVRVLDADAVRLREERDALLREVAPILRGHPQMRERGFLQTV